VSFGTCLCDVVSVCVRTDKGTLGVHSFGFLFRCVLRVVSHCVQSLDQTVCFLSISVRAPTISWLLGELARGVVGVLRCRVTGVLAWVVPVCVWRVCLSLRYEFPYIYIYVSIFLCVSLCVCAYVCVCVCVSLYRYVRLRVYVCWCMYAYV